MKNFNQSTSKWSRAACALLFGLSVCACGGDDETILPPSEGISPDVEVPDPTGTIRLAMRDEDNGNTSFGNTYLRIDNENFKGALFSDLGTVKGLGNVAHIPTAGWADQVAVLPGHGYVAYRESGYYESVGEWYRIYVVDYITNTAGGIIGADVKYQTPFKGKDEAIQLETQALTFPYEGGTQTLTFKNTGIVLFNVDKDNFPGWCTVQKTSTHDLSFLANGIAITAGENTNVTTETGTITLTTVYGKKTVIKVTRTGRAPYLSLNKTQQAYSAAAQTDEIGFTGNIALTDLIAGSSASWCKAELKDLTSNMRAASRAVKFIGDKPVSAMQNDEDFDNAATSYALHLTLDENTTSKPRTAIVTVKSKDGKVSATMEVEQRGITFEVKSNKVGFDKNANNRTLTINTTVGNWEAQSSASWCTPSKNGNRLTIRVKETTEDRTATISFKGFDTKITVRQSKYAVGDAFSENGVEGTVGYIGDSVRYVYRELGGSKWSTESVETGANSRTDGQYNVSVIKKIPYWEDNYPAFLLCDQLNTNGVTGWYLPAIDELALLPHDYTSKWSSTERHANYALYYHVDYDNYNGKGSSYSVIAVHKF